MKRTLYVFAVAAAIAFVLGLNSKPLEAVAAGDDAVLTERSRSFARLIEKSATQPVRVIVGLRGAEGEADLTNESGRTARRSSIKEVQEAFLADHAELARGNSSKLFEYIPFIAFETDAASLLRMEKDGRVVSIEEDVADAPTLGQSISVVNAPAAWTAGYTGTNWAVAVMDTGVDKNHNFLAGKVVSEACFSTTTTNVTSVCPGGASSSTAADSGLHCALTTSGCDHGTHVAGIAAGTGTSSHGVARGGNIIAVQVFSQFNTAADCVGTTTPCARSFVSNQISGLERVLTLSSSINIASVNMSLGGGSNAAYCDVAQAARKAAIDNLRAVGIATVISSGNNGFTTAIGAPACISTAISVGSTGDGSSGATLDVVSSFSNSASILDMLAPGQWISSSIPVTGSSNSFSNFAGTSMAAPHVAGAIALMKHKKPSATVTEIKAALLGTGLNITDARNGIIKPRLNVGAAVQALSGSVPFDIDGDGKTDVAIFRPVGGGGSSEWWWVNSGNSSSSALQFGTATDVIAPGDFTGDGKMDITIFRPSTGTWFVLRSEDFSFFSFPFGTTGDVPATGDYDGDGRADPAVFRASVGQWFIQRSSDQQVQIVQFGIPGDVAVTADYDGDGKDDIGIYRRNGANGGEWWINRSTAGLIALIFGTATDLTVPGDYTGDGKADIAFFRPSNGTWFVLRSEDLSFFSFPFGATGDVPSPGDYDGDGRIDAAVFRPSSATWFIQGSTSGTQIQQFGSTGDVPVPNAYVR